MHSMENRGPSLGRLPSERTSSMASAEYGESPKSKIPLRILVRVRRPFKGETAFVECEPATGSLIAVPPGAPLSFHTILGPETTQHDAFMHCGMPLIEGALHGQNACLFAYGQTGSGKTFSMFGAEGGK